MKREGAWNFSPLSAETGAASEQVFSLVAFGIRCRRSRNRDGKYHLQGLAIESLKRPRRLRAIAASPHKSIPSSPLEPPKLGAADPDHTATSWGRNKDLLLPLVPNGQFLPLKGSQVLLNREQTPK